MTQANVHANIEDGVDEDLPLELSGDSSDEDGIDHYASSEYDDDMYAEELQDRSEKEDGEEDEKQANPLDGFEIQHSSGDFLLLRMYATYPCRPVARHSLTRASSPQPSGSYNA